MSTVNPNPVKQYLGKIGIKQKYHDPILQNQKRFYIIQIQSLQIIHTDFKQPYNPDFEQKNKSKQDKTKKQSYQKNTHKHSIDNPRQEWEGRVTFEIGCRQSFTEIKLSEDNLKTADMIMASKKQKADKTEDDKKDKPTKNNDKRNNQGPENLKDKVNTAIDYFHAKQGGILKTDMHLFPFQKEQVMTIRFEVVQNSKNNQQKEYAKEYGYALVPLVPFIKMPYTQHLVEVDLVFQNQKKQIKNKLIATMTMSLYFMHNFRARLFVEVVRADLERNLALIGQMYPMIRMYLRDSEFQTDVIEEGGIKPHWKSQKQDQFCFFNIPLESVQDDLFISLFYNREVTIDEIVGKLKIDLQQETIFKKGINLEKFIQDTIQAIGSRMNQKQRNLKNDQIEKRKKAQKQRPSRNEDQKSKKHKQKNDEKTKEGMLELKTKDLYENLKLNRIKLYHKKLQVLRSNLVRGLICNVHTLDPSKPPELLNEFLDDIQKSYQVQYMSIEKSLIKDYLKLLADSPELSSFFEFRMTEHMKSIEPRKEIMKVLLDEMKEVGKIIGENMINREIQLKYINPFPKNELDTQRPVGLLEFRSFFVYEFNYLIKDKQAYVENDFY